MAFDPYYWYTDSDGNFQRYLRCKLCQTGPFKKDEIEKFFLISKNEAYCNTCAVILGVKKSSHLPVSDKREDGPFLIDVLPGENEKLSDHIETESLLENS